MKVYVLLYDVGFYMEPDVRVYGIFSSWDKAMSIATLYPCNDIWNDFWVVEYILDEKLYKKGC